MYKSILMILILLFGLSAAAAAAETLTSEAAMQNLALTIPEKLLEQRQSQVGSFDIITLQNDIKNIRWNFIDGFLAGSGKARATGIYLVQQKAVIVSVTSFNQTPKSAKPIWALHEALGALGYLDENYELTMALTLMTQNPTSIQRNAILPFLDNPKQRSRNQIYKNESGGGTSVGGGGDGYSIHAKMLALQSVELFVARGGGHGISAEKLMRRVIKTSFETDRTFSPGTMKVKVLKKLWKYEVRIPGLLWLAYSKNDSFSKNKMQLIEQILNELSKG